jgi:hypothetical protein
LVHVKVNAQAIVFLFSQEQENFWVGDLRALRQERHLSLESLKNFGGHLPFVTLGSHDITVEFSFLDELYAFAEVSV